MSEKVRELGDTVYLWFSANDTSGSAGDGASAAADVRLGGAAADAAPVLSPTPTLLSHASYPDGCYEVAVEATEANGFAAGNDYVVICTLAIDEQNPAGIIGEFRLTAADDAPNTVTAIQSGLAVAGEAAAALTDYDPLTAADVATAPANFSDLSITPTTGRVDIGAVGGTTVDDPTDLMADVSALALEETLTSMKGSTFDDSTDSLEAIRDAVDAVEAGGGSGTGSRTIVFTLSDGAGTLAGGLKTQVEDSEGNLVAGPLATDSSGVVTYYLDDGSYSLVSASSAYWQGNSEDVTVTASAAVAVTLTAQSLPVPSAADKYTVIIDAADEYGDLVGASAWAIKVLNVLPRGLSTANLVQLTEQNAITTDANGRASFEIAQETTSLTVSITPTLADATTGTPLPFTVEVSADDADDDGIIYFADLLHR